MVTPSATTRLPVATLTASPVPTATASDTPSPIPSPDTEAQKQLLAIQEAWQAGPHNYQLQKGLTTSPEATPNVPCATCHESVATGAVGAVAWWNPVSQAYETIPDGSALCQKCHEASVVVSSASNPVDMLHANLGCTGCHDPHSTMASCSNSTCHVDIFRVSDMLPATPVGGHPNASGPFCSDPSCHLVVTEVASRPWSIHGYTHVNVSCVACHDADSLEAGPLNGVGPWVAWRTIMVDEEQLKEPFFSHHIQVIVDCARCHFADNPWNLPTANEGGTVTP